MKCIIIIKKVYTIQGFSSCLLRESWSVNYSTPWQPFSYEPIKHGQNAKSIR